MSCILLYDIINQSQFSGCPFWNMLSRNIHVLHSFQNNKAHQGTGVVSLLLTSTYLYYNTFTIWAYLRCISNVFPSAKINSIYQFLVIPTVLLFLNLTEMHTVHTAHSGYSTGLLSWVSILHDWVMILN